ncbi:iron-siderophore ABC transporter substrate-binding protein [Methylopila sp. 73B]|uniref:iron-siderophore ABC transporter substrate-binding protein n=1 Tax=Methylopila sp. 73B TaxID=1120792 RepID=UPI0003783FF4|nr:iron-siderophore ABC transporter substrate-binding protein [Methylopila sp. 73B]
MARDVLGAPVCVPATPVRIVALDPWLTLGMLFELGMPPVAAPLIGIQDDGVRKEAERVGVADVGLPLEPSLERIAALSPDLIVGSSYLHAKIEGAAARIAPTILIDPIDWKQHFRILASLVGRTEQAEAALGAYEARAAAIKASARDGAVSVVRVAPSGFQVYLDGPAAYAPYAVLRDAGVKRTPYETTTDQTVVKRPGWEQLAGLQGDVLLVVVVSGYDPSQDDRLAAATFSNPLWKMLPAVRAGRVYRVDRATWMGFHGVASAHRVLDDVERYLR